MDEELLSSLALASVFEIGARRFALLFGEFGSARRAYNAPKSELRRVLGHTHDSLVEHIVDSRKRRSVTLRIERLLADVRAVQIEPVWLGSQDYPRLLRYIPDPPPVLWVRGLLKPEAERVAVVGTRQASAYGRKVARLIGAQLARSGYEVVSGLALGIDCEAHEAVTSHGGMALAVLGTAVDALKGYKERLAQKIVSAGGAVVTEYTPGTVVQKYHFVARNRIISGLSSGVVVVEAPARSGALITAGFALEQGREVMAVPGSVLSTANDGGHALLRDGAALVRCGDDVMAVLGQSRYTRCSRVRMQSDNGV